MLGHGISLRFPFYTGLSNPGIHLACRIEAGAGSPVGHVCVLLELAKFPPAATAIGPTQVIHSVACSSPNQDEDPRMVGFSDTHPNNRVSFAYKTQILQY